MKGDDIRLPPFETADLRRELSAFLNHPFLGRKAGDFRWGVYAFFDYDGEPIYVGQTNERLRTRIRRHLTNQRTDAVAMSVLDPFEVYEIEVWPMPELDAVTKDSPPSAKLKAASLLNSLERSVFDRAIRQSHFKAILNEKDPPGAPKIALPKSFRREIVSPEVFKVRSHPDFRIARRAATLARLAQVISERQVQFGLRRALLTQAKRLQWLADRRLSSTSPADDTSDDGD